MDLKAHPGQGPLCSVTRELLSEAVLLTLLLPEPSNMVSAFTCPGLIENELFPYPPDSFQGPQMTLQGEEILQNTTALCL